MPTRILSGPECIEKNSALLTELGKKAFIMTGRSSAERNGSLTDMIHALDAQGIGWVHYNKVNPNPSLEEVRAAAEEARAAGVDFIVAIGTHNGGNRQRSDPLFDPDQQHAADKE